MRSEGGSVLSVACDGSAQGKWRQQSVQAGRRFDLLVEGKWETLLKEASSVVHGSHFHTNDAKRKALAACRKVQAGEVTRARQCLTGSTVAPGTDEMFRALQSRRPQEVQRAIPRAVMEWSPNHLSKSTGKSS